MEYRSCCETLNLLLCVVVILVLISACSDEEQIGGTLVSFGLLCFPSQTLQVNDLNNLDVSAALFRADGRSTAGEPVELDFGPAVTRAFDQVGNQELDLSGTTVLTGDFGVELEMDCNPNASLGQCFVQMTNTSIGAFSTCTASFSL